MYLHSDSMIGMLTGAGVEVSRGIENVQMFVKEQEEVDVVVAKGLI